MTWIRMVPESEADGVLRDAYAEAGAARERVADVLRAHGVHPEILVAHLRLYMEVMFGRSELTRRERETVAVAVSVANGCHY